MFGFSRGERYQRNLTFLVDSYPANNEATNKRRRSAIANVHKIGRNLHKTSAEVTTDLDSAAEQGAQKMYTSGKSL